MLRLFNIFGRSAAINALDDALRSSGVHPLLVPDAVKLTVLRLNKDEFGSGAGNGAPDFTASARLLAYCMLGRDPFIESVGEAEANHADDRLEAAIDTGESLDARIVLLALHAGLVAPDIADRIEIEGSEA